MTMIADTSSFGTFLTSTKADTQRSATHRVPRSEVVDGTRDYKWELLDSNTEISIGRLSVLISHCCRRRQGPRDARLHVHGARRTYRACRLERPIQCDQQDAWRVSYFENNFDFQSRFFRGAFGRVFLGQCRTTQSKVAVKVVQALGDGNDHMASLRTEIDVLQKAKHVSCLVELLYCAYSPRALSSARRTLRRTRPRRTL